MSDYLGSIIRSNGHTDYVCQIYGVQEVATVPTPDSYAFGTFVRVRLETVPTCWLVALIYDTLLLNPEFGRMGPRLSPRTEITVFAPDYLNEKATLVGLVAIGTIDASGEVEQGVPALSATTDARVQRMSREAIRDFHSRGGALRLTYLPVLLAQGSPLVLPLLQRVIAQLREMLEEAEQQRMLGLLVDELRWQAQVSPLGGGR